MTRITRAWLAVGLIAALIAYGGAGDQVRPLLAIVVALALIGTASGLRQHLHQPPLGWIAWLFLPPIAIALIQVLPLGWHHPWVSDDLATLGVSAATWSIDPSASREALVWFITLAALALAVTVLARGDRVRGLVEALIYVAAMTAVLGLGLSLTAAPWPSEDSVSKVRGPFIYPNHAAAFWAACLPLATLIAHRRGGALRWGTVALLALAVLLSGSRGGILVASVVMLPIAVYLLPRQRRIWWAAGGALVVAGWLWVIGLDEVADKFERLRGDEGSTLNGRVTLWRAALPVIADAGALGSGGNTTVAAFRRSGETHFAAVLVNHLHNDPLEWWLEYGWLGTLVAAGALLAALARLRPEPATWTDAGRRTLTSGAIAGLLILALHSCGDFIWHSPAVAIEGVLLLCVLALSGRTEETATTGRLRIQWLCGSVAVVLLIGAWPSWQWNTSENLARDVERLVVARRAAGLPITGAEVIEQASVATPANVRLAVTQAWLAQAAGDHAAAADALMQAARFAPGDASAWTQRALLAADRHDAAATGAAIHRALVWAPAWPDIHQVALQLVASGDRSALPRAQVADILTAVIALDRAQPAWFFPLAAEILGMDGLTQQLHQAGPLLARSAEDWLARQGPLAEWQALRARAVTTPPPRRLATLGPANDRLLGERGWEPYLPLDVDERRALGETLTTSGLPVPTPLAEALTNDGQPWARWGRPVDLLDTNVRTELALLLRSELHRAWARTWADRVTFANRALVGDLAVITRDSDPAVLACLAGVDPQHPTPAMVESAVRLRAHSLLQRWREWEWQELPQAGRWSWWFGDGTGSALIDAERWTGVIVDGQWLGWIRGRQDLAPLLGHGLRRVVLLTP
jgi:O-antigen ligase